MANKIIHKRSSALLENGKPKLPTADNLEYGELAINFAKGAETISFKNKADEIVTISSTERLEQIIIDNEEVTAAALTDLDERMLAVENKGSLTIDDVYAEGFLTYVPSEYVTESELADKGYLTSIPANYVTESELEAALSTVDVDLSDYMTIDELEETYASKDDLSTLENELGSTIIVGENYAIPTASEMKLGRIYYGINMETETIGFFMTADNQTISGPLPTSSSLIFEVQPNDNYTSASLSSDSKAIIANALYQVGDGQQIVQPTIVKIDSHEYYGLSLLHNDQSLGTNSGYFLNFSSVQSDTDDDIVFLYLFSPGANTDNLHVESFSLFNIHQELAKKSDSGHTHSEFEIINATIEENELVIANALNDLNERVVLLENVNASIAIANLNNQITTMQQTITELQAEIETMKTELNKTLTVE